MSVEDDLERSDLGINDILIGIDIDILTLVDFERY